VVRNYVSLFLSKPRFFIFSITEVFFSAPGQTFLISLVIPYVCVTYAISPMAFAAVYSSATLIASLFLPLIGAINDDWPPPVVIAINAAVFSVAIAMFSMGWGSLFFSLFLMRLFGQGALPLNAAAMTIKQFQHRRASALSLTQLGYPLSELILPSIVVIGVVQMGWQSTYLMMALGILIIYLPIAWVGVPKHVIQKKNRIPSVSFGDAVNDKFLPAYIAISTIPSIMMTAAFFFQADIFLTHHWDVSLNAVALFFYAGFKLCAILIIGRIIDCWGVVISLSFLIACIGVATGLISIGGSPWVAVLYYSLYGIGLGASASTVTMLWAKLYGDAHIAKISGLISIVRNGSTALAPIGFSFIYYKLQVPLFFIFNGCGVFILLLSVLPFLFQKWDSRLKGPSNGA
jgi:MFS family permease